MKQVTCSQMRVVSENDLQQISGGSFGQQVVKAANYLQQFISRSPGCVAGARRAAQGRNSGSRGKKG